MGTEPAEATRSPEELQTDQAAYEQLQPRYRAFSAAELLLTRPNMWRAALYALSVAEKINQPGWREDFAKLPAEKFDEGLLKLLELAARGALYASAQAATAGSLGSEAKLPAGLAREGSTVRERMLKVVDYHLGEDAEIGSVLAEIRRGTGYADLSADLWRLAQLYRDHVALLAADPSHYVAEDPDSAERLAKGIQNALSSGSSPKQRQQQDMLARAWTLLFNTYEQVAKPGRWLFEDRGGKELFVSLFSKSRRPPRPRRKAAPTSESIAE